MSDTPINIAMPRFALIEEATGLVVNVIIMEEGDPLPEGFIAVESAEADLGDTYDGTQFIHPPPISVEEVPE